MDPKLGRFITPDPVVSNIFSSQRLNAYSYVVNRPLSLIDPSGFDPNDIHYEFPMVLIEASPEFRTGQAAKELAAHDRTTAQESGADAATTDIDVTGGGSIAVSTGLAREGRGHR